MSGELSFAVDEGEDIIRVRGTGLWTAEQAADHFVALREAIDGLHAQGRPAYVLVDLRLAAVQVAHVAQAVSDGTRQIYRETDRVALVAGTALLGMQMKNAAQVPHIAICETAQQALDWLRAERSASAAG